MGLKQDRRRAFGIKFTPLAMIAPLIILVCVVFVSGCSAPLGPPLAAGGGAWRRTRRSSHHPPPPMGRKARDL